MIKIEKTEVVGWEAAARGMRNPLESWGKSDSYWGLREDPSPINPNDASFFFVGDNDLALMQRLVNAGSDHRKFLRMIVVYADITAPLYWWKEYDTYKVGTVANSCSTMHTLHKRNLTLDDFSAEHLGPLVALPALEATIHALNYYRKAYQKTKNKENWYQMIQLLPTSYNQKRTVMPNYEVLLNMYHARKNHKLDEWHDFCDWVEQLPYFKEICLENGGNENE